MIAAVKVRSDTDARQNTKRTLTDLNLENKNQCVIFEVNDSLKGMLDVAKDYITFGEIEEETLDKLEERKGEDVGHGDVVRLSPPSRGFRSTKKQVGQGGSLGERENMDELIQRMV